MNTLQTQVCTDNLTIVRATLSSAAQLARNMICDLIKLDAQCAELHNQLFSSISIDGIASNCAAAIEDVYATIRRAGNALYAISSVPPSQGLLSDPTAEETSHYQLLLPLDQIQAYLEPHAIYVHTPMLCSMHNKKLRRGQPVEHCVMYRDAVQRAIMLAPGYADYNFSRYREKIVHYLFIYASTHEQHIDNDNHLTKHVTDRITHLFPGGDSALSCNFYYSARIDKTIPSGTYITITPKQYGIQSEENIVLYWQDKFKNQ